MEEIKEKIDDRCWIVYMHINKINRKRYIGITSRNDPNKRWENGYGYKYNLHFWNAIQKYGWDNFEHEIVEDKLTQQEACEKEILLIKLYDTTNPNNGYNLSTGGMLGSVGVVRSQEFRDHLSIIMSGKPKSKESIEKMRKTKTGRKLTEEERATRKEKMSQYPNPFLGKSHTDESKRKMSDAKKGKYLGSNNPKAKLYYCIELNEIFLSARDANEKYNIPKSHICSCCTGARKYCGKHPTTHEPLSWRFVYDELKDDGDVILGAISLGYITQEDVDNFYNKINKNIIN